MAGIHPEFAQYCCELLGRVGRCTAKRMFGGWGISTDGLTIAIIADLGQGETLWLKANDDSRIQYETQGCARFIYDVQGQPKGMNYYSAPPDAMESPALMAPWARVAMEAALLARSAKPQRKPKAATSKVGKPRALNPTKRPVVQSKSAPGRPKRT
jgi:DNA transformation protein and related proteins